MFERIPVGTGEGRRSQKACGRESDLREISAIPFNAAWIGLNHFGNSPVREFLR
jgi:hypothetical protein